MLDKISSVETLRENSMPKVGENTVTGKSGTAYHLNVYTKDMQFNDFIPGVYVISEVSEDGERFVFVGETDNIHPLLKEHPSQTDLDAENYNRISFHMNASRKKREMIVADLTSVLKPVCN